MIGMGSKMSGEENLESLVSRDPMPAPMLLNCIFIPIYLSSKQMPDAHALEELNSVC